MKTLKYKVIKSEKQYDRYCSILYHLDFKPGKKTRPIQDEMDLLTLLIEAYDREHYPVPELDPVEMLKAIMEDHKLSASKLSSELGITKGYLSQILNYKKGFSKDIIRKLASKFKMQQEAFNRPYTLTGLKGRKKKAA